MKTEHETTFETSETFETFETFETLKVTIELKDKSRINISIVTWTGQGFFFKFTSLHNWGKGSDLQSSDYWQIYLCTFFPPLA